MEAITFQHSRKKIYYNLSGFYYLFFFGVGAFYPLLAIYYQEQGLNGSQIGVLMSIGHVVAIIVKPIWGMICDRFGIQKQILLFTLLLSGLIALLFPFTQTYAIFFLLSVLLSLFQSAIVPLSDNISMNFVQKYGGSYGDIRLWGAIGFAVAVWVAGILSDLINIGVIFYLYAISLGISALLTRKIPDETGNLTVSLTRGLKNLIKLPSYTLFLVGGFLLFGTMNANNAYFGLFYQHIGGTVTGVGFAFFLAAGSEAPLMKIFGTIMRRFGLLPIILFSAVVTTARWLFYASNPSVGWVLATTFVQGFSIGLYLPASIQFIKEITPKEIEVTALALYGAVSIGLGTMVSTMIGGWVYDHFGILQTYLYLAVISFLAFFVFLMIGLVGKKS